jgi:hypothetical protein
MVQQPPVGRIDRPTGDELVDLGVQPPSLGRGTCLVQLAGVAPIPDRQRTLEDAADGVRGLGLALLGVGDSSRQRRSRCAKQVWWAARMNLRYGAHPSRSNTPAKPSPSTAAASAKPRPAATR